MERKKKHLKLEKKNHPRKQNSKNLNSTSENI